jgi:hypothetical protein
VIGAQKRIPSLKFGEAFLYKNDLVNEGDGAYGVYFQYDDCRIHIKARFNRVICSASNLQDLWLDKALTVNARDPPINLDDLCCITIGDTFRVCRQTYKVNEVTFFGFVVDFCVFSASRRGEVYGPTSLTNIKQMIQNIIR